MVETETRGFAFRWGRSADQALAGQTVSDGNAGAAVSPTLTGNKQEVGVIRAVEPDTLAAHDEVFERTI